MLVNAVATARVSSAVMNDATATTSSTRLRTTSEMSMPTDARARRYSTGPGFELPEATIRSVERTRGHAAGHAQAGRSLPRNHGSER
jgi:hypothetical protein